MRDAPGEAGRPDPSAVPLAGAVRAMEFLVNVLEAYCTVLMVGMAVIVLTGVIYRYVIERALPWYDEFAEFLLVWLTFYGMILAGHRRAHIGFETLLDYMPGLLRRSVAVFASLVVLLVQVALAYYGWQLVQAAGFDRAVSLPSVRLSWIYSAIPVSGLLMFVITARDLVLSVRDLFGAATATRA